MERFFIVDAMCKAPFYKMLNSITSSSLHDQMLRAASPLTLLGINHFWYYKITFSGDYSYLGTHSTWNEFCISKAMSKHFPCLRHPEALQIGINLMKVNADDSFKEVLDIAWEKYNINFSINLISKISEGIEAWGFATHFNDAYADQRLLNELPLLRFFIKQFRKDHKKLFHILDDNQVNLPESFGPLFYQCPKMFVATSDRTKFLRKMGLGVILTLTPREIDVLKFLMHGFPASYISEQLKLSPRTVENYIATIKEKLECQTKVELIQKFKGLGDLLWDAVP